MRHRWQLPRRHAFFPFPAGSARENHRRRARSSPIRQAEQTYHERIAIQPPMFSGAIANRRKITGFLFKLVEIAGRVNQNNVTLKTNFLSTPGARAGVGIGSTPSHRPLRRESRILAIAVAAFVSHRPPVFFEK
ncbi:MAG: hypothetical protein WD875_09520 [Pirellulales bacterium]